MCIRDRIREIRAHIPEDMEIETFVHGAMCISYSGRCLLSNYLVGRDANRGACTHPCRWKYSIVEEKRPGEYMPVFENERGTYIFNSKDLCMIEHMDDILTCGIDSLSLIHISYYLAHSREYVKVAVEKKEELKVNDLLTVKTGGFLEAHILLAEPSENSPCILQ